MDSNVYWEWLADKAMLMVHGKHKEYPVPSDAALFVMLSPQPKQVDYTGLVSFLESATSKNKRNELGFPIVALDFPNGKSINIALDFSQKNRLFRLVNLELTNRA